MQTLNNNLKHRLLALQKITVELLSVVFVWVVFYRLSMWIFALFQYNDRISWIFLPAGIRILVVLLLGWRGVGGLFIGAILTNDATNLQHILILSAISALAPMLAMKICKRLFDTPFTLQGLTAKNLLCIAVLCAIFNSGFSVTKFWLGGRATNIYGVFPMFIGDLSGAMIILILASYIARIFEGQASKTKSEK